MIEILEAKTPDEKERVFRFRYQIYVEERGKRFHDADHGDKRLCDDWDETATILYARDAGEIVGSLRSNRLDQVKIDPALATRLCLDAFLSSYPGSALSMSSRFVIAPSHRNSFAAAQLVVEIYRRVLRMGVEFDFLHCAPGLIGLYERLGFRRYCGNYLKDDTGIQIPMALVIRDQEHLRATSSPFLSTLADHAVDAAPATWFAETFPAQHRFLNHTATEEPEFWRALVEITKRPLNAASSLFQGLSEDEVRSFARSATLHAFEPGESIVRAQDSGDEMYAILSGIVDVYADDGQRKQILRTLGPGEVFGEMALFNRSIRSATVVASTPVEALVLTHGSLARASQKDPAIASRLLLNLARVLSQRLDSLTQRLSEASRREVVDDVFS